MLRKVLTLANGFHFSTELVGCVNDHMFYL